MLLILKQADDIEARDKFSHGCFFFFLGKETLTAGKGQRTHTSPAQVEK